MLIEAHVEGVALRAQCGLVLLAHNDVLKAADALEGPEGMQVPHGLSGRSLLRRLALLLV